MFTHTVCYRKHKTHNNINFFWEWDPLVFFLFLLLYKYNNNIREYIYIGNIIVL